MTQILWRITTQNPAHSLPCGLVTYELRAPSEAVALDRVAQYRPDLTVLSIARKETPHER